MVLRVLLRVIRTVLGNHQLAQTFRLSVTNLIGRIIVMGSSLVTSSKQDAPSVLLCQTAWID